MSELPLVAFDPDVLEALEAAHAQVIWQAPETVLPACWASS